MMWNSEVDRKIEFMFAKVFYKNCSTDEIIIV